MGIKGVQLKRNNLIVDDTEYKFTPGLRALITLKQPQSTQWNSNDYQAYKNIVAQTRVRSFPNKTGNTTTRYVEMETVVRANGYACGKDTRRRRGRRRIWGY